MKKIISTIIALLMLGTVSAVEVVDDCWLEQQQCTEWNFWHTTCLNYEWVTGDCEVEPEKWSGEGEWCRLQCTNIEVTDFNEEDYYTKEDVNDMFGDTFNYLHANYYNKWVVNSLFWKYWKLMQKLTDIEEYISGHEGKWSTDVVGGGVSFKNVEKMINESTALMKEWVLNLFNPYEYRLKALEYAMNEINSGAFCRGKVSAMVEYNLPSIECNGETYFNVEGKGLAVGPA